MSDLLSVVKARVALDRVRHFAVSGWPTQKCAFCYAGEDAIATAASVNWPCDAAKYLSVAEARLAGLERELASFNHGERVRAESELREMARLLGVQG